MQQGSAAAPKITTTDILRDPEEENQEPETKNKEPKCPCCQQPMVMIARIMPAWKRGALWQPVQSRAPPSEMKGGASA